MSRFTQGIAGGWWCGGGRVPFRSGIAALCRFSDVALLGLEAGAMASWRRRREQRDAAVCAEFGRGKAGNR